MHIVLAILVSFALSFTALAQEHNSQDFGGWLAEFKQEAVSSGISEATLDAAFAETEPLPRVLELDRAQPETTMTRDEYLAHVVNKKRVAQGKKELAKNHKLLTAIGKKYGVQPRFIVALWGIETNFGARTGNFNILDSLATLAYDGRRSAFFRGELIKALTIVERYGIAPSEMRGSWAGAMGQCQFMPSSYLNFAVDHNADGHPDIWKNKGDVFASIANYLKKSGWNGDEGWGRPVRLPEGFDASQADIKTVKSLLLWKRMGVEKASGGALPKKDLDASLILVGEGDGAAPYIVYNNYKVLLKWNRSRYFATAVGMLADKIGGQK